MLNPITLFIAVPLLIGIWIGLRHTLPALLITSGGLLAWFVVFPLLAAMDQPISIYDAEIFKGQLLALLYSALFVGSALFFRAKLFKTRVVDTAYLIQVEAGRAHSPRTLLIASFLLVVVGLTAAMIFGSIGGGIGWARVEGESFSGMGALAGVAGNTLLFPLVVFYLFQIGVGISPVVAFLAILNFAYVVWGYLHSGVSTGPLTALLPFGVLWMLKRGRFSKARFLVSCFAGYGAVWIFRFMRMLGVLSYAGSYSVRLTDALDMYSNSALKASASISEFFWFSKVVSWVDNGGPRMHGRSYLLAIIQFIPSFMWPGKTDFVQSARVDSYVRDVVFSKQFGGLLPIGFYGEGYINFGLIGLIGVAIMLGFLASWTDSRFFKTILRIPGPLIGSILCGVFIGTCRMDTYYAFGLLAPLVLAALVMAVLAPLGRDQSASMTHAIQS